jgi:poly-gamma-glutamate capsule biosynthesis protein CapA/YwtB (metallophosphatase superfamily)
MRKCKTRTGFRGLELFAIGLFVTTLVISSASLVRGQGAVGGDGESPRVRHDAAKELAMKITEPFTFAAVGDILAPRRPFGQLQDAGFQALIKVMRAADMTYANLEGPIINVSDPDYHGPQVPVGNWLPITIIDDLKSMGVRIMSTANNQSMNDGADGVFRTNRLLDEARITHAGTGRNLTDARAARFASTPKGTIGVVGIFSIDPTSNPERPVRYSDARDSVPGLNPLHVTPYNVVTAEQMASLRKIRDAVYANRSEVAVPIVPVPPNESTNELSLFGTLYKVGEKVGSLSYQMDPKDLAGIIQSIRYGKQNSDFMIVAMHTHQNTFAYQAYSHDNSSPDFLVEMAHRAIDNGADIFVGHGVHTLRGVEIYKGKPIFYGVASFIFQEGPAGYITDPSRSQPVGNESAAPLGPSDTHEPLLATSKYEGGKLVEVRLYPADTGIDGTRTISKSGIPMTPSPEQAQRILKLLQDVSKPFGTKISIENNVGVIRVSQTGAKESGAER